MQNPYRLLIFDKYLSYFIVINECSLGMKVFMIFKMLSKKVMEAQTLDRV